MRESIQVSLLDREQGGEESKMGLEQEVTNNSYSTKNSTLANLHQVKILKYNLRKVREQDSEMRRNQDQK